MCRVLCDIPADFQFEINTGLAWLENTSTPMDIYIAHLHFPPDSDVQTLHTDLVVLRATYNAGMSAPKILLNAPMQIKMAAKYMHSAETNQQWESGVEAASRRRLQPMFGCG